MFIHHLWQLAALASSVIANPLDVTVAAARNKAGTAIVNLRNLASGALYGLPQDVDQIPSHFFTDIGFNFMRAGGSQLPSKGWIENVTSYEVCNVWCSQVMC